MKSIKDYFHVELASGRKPDVLDYAAAAILGGTLIVCFAPLLAVAAVVKPRRAVPIDQNAHIAMRNQMIANRAFDISDIT